MSFELVYTVPGNLVIKETKESKIIAPLLCSLDSPLPKHPCLPELFAESDSKYMYIRKCHVGKRILFSELNRCSLNDKLAIVSDFLSTVSILYENGFGFTKVGFGSVVSKLEPEGREYQTSKKTCICVWPSTVQWIPDFELQYITRNSEDTVSEWSFANQCLEVLKEILNIDLDYVIDEISESKNTLSGLALFAIKYKVNLPYSIK